MKRYNILITGCGGDISQSMGKILRTYDRAERIIGCDVHDSHAGHFIFHKCFIVEMASSQSYLDSIARLVSQQNIDIIIPATEFELEYFLINGYDKLKDQIFIGPNNLALEIGLDKFRTAKFLEKHHLPFPKTVLLEDVTTPVFPCIIKARRGSGSKTVHIVKDQYTFALVSKILKDAVCQEYLDSVDDEFTCALFQSRSEILRSIIFRRKLTSGYSSFGIVEKIPAIQELLEKLAKSLNLVGSINIQLRMQKGIPMVFEINSRFSSTVFFRHLLGFEDLIWSIEDKIGITLSSYNEVPEGSKFYKGFQEYIVRG